MAEKKLTKTDKINLLLEIEEVKNNEMLVDFLNNEKKLLKKKRTTKTSAENEKLKEILLDILADTKEPLTITQMLETEVLTNFKTESGKKLSNQKINALITQLKNEHEVFNVRDKKKSMYRLPNETDVWEEKETIEE